jgi:hypothetical protein
MRSRRLLARLMSLALVLGFTLWQAAPALACGGLVAPNGAIRLSRATTLVAWHNGIEHYMTAFTYEGDVANLGWIVPLPAIPTSIQEGGAWTLQRLGIETHPQPSFGLDNARGATAAAPAQVIEQVQVEALDITVLKGSGQAIVDWCTANGFSIAGDTRDHLLIYAKGSPIFMAAKFDNSRAQARHQLTGDGAPVLITMPTSHLWVPLEVLALDGQTVNADIYLLTDKPVNTSDVAATVGQSPVGTTVPGAPGFTVSFQEQMNAQLFHDLSTDRNMGWVRSDGWLTYLNLSAPSEEVTYDLGLTDRNVIHLAPFGTAPMAVGGGRAANSVPSWLPQLPLGTPGVVLAWIVLGTFIAGMIFLIAPWRPKSASVAPKRQQE